MGQGERDREGESAQHVRQLFMRSLPTVWEKLWYSALRHKIQIDDASWCCHKKIFTISTKTHLKCCLQYTPLPPFILVTTPLLVKWSSIKPFFYALSFSSAPWKPKWGNGCQWEQAGARGRERPGTREQGRPVQRRFVGGCHQKILYCYYFIFMCAPRCVICIRMVARSGFGFGIGSGCGSGSLAGQTKSVSLAYFAL